MGERSAFAAIAQDRRRELIEYLVLCAEQERLTGSITDIAAAIGMDRSTTSRQLAFLRESGVLHASQRGLSRPHQLVVEPFLELEDWVCGVTDRLRRANRLVL